MFAFAGSLEDRRLANYEIDRDVGEGDAGPACGAAARLSSQAGCVVDRVRGIAHEQTSSANAWAEAPDKRLRSADLRAYLDADRRLCDTYANPDAWTRKAILNVAASGRFSSDRTITEYASEIWHVASCPIP